MKDRRSLLEANRALLESEQGTLRKGEGFSGLRVALCYPSPYRVGMSSLGFQTIYRELNGRPDVVAERGFLPDDVEAYREARAPVLTLEGEAPLQDYPVLAFSVSFELEVAGIFEMLSLSGIPLLNSDRDERHPLIVAGGPLTFSNPDPLEPFVDVIVQGEADQLVHQLMDLVQTLPRAELLERLAKTPGFRVPALGSGVRYFVSKADTAKLPAHSQVITPNTELRSMFLVEPERGCSRGCHYCVMRRTTNGGMRTVAVDRVLSLIPEHATRVGLVGAAVTDHPKIVELLRRIVDTGREVGVSSLRADRLSQDLVDQLRRGGAQVLTVASDGASQRMRNLVDRKHSEEQILRAAAYAKQAGMERLKVYNMVGLPLETEADIDELARFTVELSRIIPVALGVAPFVAKRNTPLDGSPFGGVKEIERRLEQLRRGLQGKAEVRPTSARWAWVEYMLAQCGPEAGLAAMDAWRNGGAYAAWKRAFEDRGVVPYLARRVDDDRRNPTVWPIVENTPATPRAQASAEAQSRSRLPLQ